MHRAFASFDSASVHLANQCDLLSVDALKITSGMPSCVDNDQAALKESSLVCVFTAFSNISVPILRNVWQVNEL